MGQAIGGSLPLAVGIALSPIPIIAVILILTSDRARVNGLAFGLGWLAGLGIVGAIFLSLAGTGGEQIRCPGHVGELGRDRSRHLAAPGRGPPVPRPSPRQR